MFKFLKRQWKTKTGRSGILGIVGAGLSVATGTLPLAAGAVAAYAGLQTMLLRDKEAKKEEAKRNGNQKE
jgi:hypothetical protein